jgi:hypothetical protein
MMRSHCGGIDEDGINGRGEEGTGGDREGVPLRGSPIAAVLGTRATPHIANGPCPRGVAGTVEFLEYAGYAGVVGGDPVLPRPPTKASSVSPMGSILLSSIGGGIPALGGGPYVVRGAPETTVPMPGVYASFESGLELGATFPLAPSAIGEERDGKEGRGDDGTCSDDRAHRLSPAIGFCWPC